eukprot:scaffold21336_cov98-Isochrysis_galbana.AAC.6
MAALGPCKLSSPDVCGEQCVRRAHAPVRAVERGFAVRCSLAKMRAGGDRAPMDAGRRRGTDSGRGERAGAPGRRRRSGTRQAGGLIAGNRGLVVGWFWLGCWVRSGGGALKREGCGGDATPMLCF